MGIGDWGLGPIPINIKYYYLINLLIIYYSQIN